MTSENTRLPLPTGLTQEQLAQRAKLSVKTVHNYVHGRPVRPDTQRRITRVLNRINALPSKPTPAR